VGCKYDIVMQQWQLVTQISVSCRPNTNDASKTLTAVKLFSLWLKFCLPTNEPPVIKNGNPTQIFVFFTVE